MALAMRRILQYRHDSRIYDVNKSYCFQLSRGFCESPQPNEVEEEFDVLELYPRPKPKPKQAKQLKPNVPPRTTKMNPSMDWMNIWPGPKTYHPASVPLPLRQGCNKHGPPPGRFGNTELMKIPNFLHLTPPAIEKHCQALKQFCTKWPEELKDENAMEKHFPIEIITSDYCHSSCTIRDPNARVVSLKVKLKNLELDAHAKDKFLRIVGNRYDPKSDYVTITTNSCPIKKQNYDYAHYLLTAIYFESWKKEDWESMKSEDDMETYIFSERQCGRNAKKLFAYNGRTAPDLTEFKTAVEDWLNKGDDPALVEKYKKAAQKLLSLPSFDAQSYS